MTFVEFCAGIGGFSVGFERAGLQCAGMVENNDFCLSVLNKHWPNVPKWRDMKEMNYEEIQGVDILCGGIPCQPFSLSGKGEGEADDRNLWPYFKSAIQTVRPKFIVVENVPGIMGRGRKRHRQIPGHTILKDLAALGYDAEWENLPAAAFGAPHERSRMWFVAYPCGFAESQEDKAFSPFRSVRDTRENVGGMDRAPFSDIARHLHSPRTIGSNDGLRDRMERCHALGNALVPCIAEYIGKQLVRVSQSKV